MPSHCSAGSDSQKESSWVLPAGLTDSKKCRGNGHFELVHDEGIPDRACRVQQSDAERCSQHVEIAVVATQLNPNLE